MRLLIEAHHPAHIHFFKHPVRLWRERGDEVLLLGRDRDVMKQLLAAYSFIPTQIITGTRRGNRFPLREMLARQAAVAQAIRSFRPDVVVSLMGSYTQAARVLGVPNIIFTDSEFQMRVKTLKSSTLTLPAALIVSGSLTRVSRVAAT